MRHVPDIISVLNSVFSRINMRRDWAHRRELGIGEWREVDGGWQMGLGEFEARLDREDDKTWSMRISRHLVCIDWSQVTDVMVRCLGNPHSITLERAKIIVADHGLHYLEVIAAHSISDASILREKTIEHQL